MASFWYSRARTPHTLKGVMALVLKSELEMPGLGLPELLLCLVAVLQTLEARSIG